MSSTGKVLSADARHVTSAKTSDVTLAEAAHVASAEATDMTSAKAADVASATTTVPSTAAAAGLCVSGKKAAGKHCTCQNHYHSSSHDILLWMGGDFSAIGPCQTSVCPRKANANVAMDRRWGFLFFRSTKFPFNHLALARRECLRLTGESFVAVVAPRQCIRERKAYAARRSGGAMNSGPIGSLIVSRRMRSISAIAAPSMCQPATSAIGAS